MSSGEYCVDNDSYAILGVHIGSDGSEIKRAFRQLALKMHPDKFPEPVRKEAHKAFVRMNNAYDILTNESTRRQYNHERSSHLRELYMSRPRKVRQSMGFAAWMINHMTQMAKDERKRLVQLNELRANHDKERDEERKEQEARQAEQRDNARKQEEERREQRQQEKQRREEQERNQGDTSTSKRKEIWQEMLAYREALKAKVEHEWKLWMANQQAKCDAAAGYPSELRRQEEEELEELSKDQKREKDKLVKKLEAQMKLEVEKLRKKQQEQNHSLRKSYNRKLDQHTERMNRQREIMKSGRKRKREEVSEFNKKIDEDNQRLRSGREPKYNNIEQPQFKQPSYGFTQSGNPCHKCMSAGGFCKQHQDQA